MGMNAFSLFCGFRFGAAAFGLLLQQGFPAALAIIAFLELRLGILARAIAP